MGYKAYKVIDAKDGIIERFEYESATFKIVERREPKVGDYLVIMDEESVRSLTDTNAGGPYFITVGKPYIIMATVTEGGYIFKDDFGSFCYLNRDSSNHAIYEKVKPPKETITYKGRDHKLVDRKARPGDVVIFDYDTSSNIVGTYITAGMPYMVIDGGSNIPAFTDDIGRLRNVYNRSKNRTDSTVKVYEPVEPQKRLIYRDSEGVTHTVLNAELVAYSSVEEVPE
ncbi:hypothetical protein [Shouchella clausii]|uniref:hypothetical protein n=1 Tax=Shouchella clausii TaxID=79880 RepID=UPI001C73852B|nr:hypothetical protein [Shouchella clausii]MBX0320247.1 hypothetical protein [Shouchella clausii]